MRIRKLVGGEQDWVNEVYLWEKFDIGLEFNVRIGLMQVGHYQEKFSEKYNTIYQLEKRSGQLHGECHYFPLCCQFQA